MTEEPERKPMTLAAMPGILVMLTLGYLFVMHAGRLMREKSEVEWSGAGLERHYLEVGAAEVSAPVNRLRARLGLDANDVVQRGGELYYLPDIAHVAGRSFLREDAATSHVVLRREGEVRREANPLPAILDFDRQLRARGVRLVLLPTPSKAMFASPGIEPLRNEGAGEFLLEMKRRDIPVFDLSPHFAKCGEGGRGLFMETDSHWTPEGMRIGAILLAAFLEREGLLPEGADQLFRGETEEIRGGGDLAVLVEGGTGAKWQETIAVHPVSCMREGLGEWTRWVPDRNSPVLLLGDSFTNVFSLDEMGWGKEAGFAETLSQSLGFSVDRVARNADGAFASREELQRDPGRLEEKTVVVWQFAARELSFGDWKVLPLPDRGQDARPEAVAGRIELEGTIAAVAPVPKLTRTPYRRAVMEIHLVDVRSGEAEVPDEVVLLGLGVENRVPTGMTKWKAGRKLKVVAAPWGKVQERYGRLHRFSLVDPDLKLIGAARFWIGGEF